MTSPSFLKRRQEIGYLLLYTTLSTTMTVIQVTAKMATANQRYLYLLVTTLRRKMGPGWSGSWVGLPPRPPLDETTDDLFTSALKPFA